MLAGHLALTVAALFAGAAVFVSVAEQPARLGLDDRALLAQWNPSYARGLVMQGSLAIVGCLLGLWAWWRTGRIAFLAGAVLLVANWPWTVIAMMATNKALIATDLDAAGPASRALLLRWGSLHALRTALGFASTAAFLVALS